jgi:hypothetical protein
MSRIFAALVLLLGIVWLAQQPKAQIGTLGCGAVSQHALVFQPCGVASTPPAMYTGPGDVKSGALGWWGASGYTAMDTAPAWNVCNVSDVVCADWAIGANGYVTPALVGGSNCGIVTCTIKTMYDRSGAMHCSGAVVCDITQATIANRAVVVLNALGTFACAQTSGTSGQGYDSVANFSLSQPLTALIVANRATAGRGAINSYLQGGGNTLYYEATGNDLVDFFSGGNANATATDGSFHSVQTVGNDPTATVFYVDGTTTSVASAGNGAFSGTLHVMSGAAGAQVFNGVMCDVGIWPSAFSGTDLANINTNRHMAYGSW